MSLPLGAFLWNMFLSFLPVAAGYLLEAGVRRYPPGRREGRKGLWIVWLLLGGFWLAFLPNSCYLMTEWRHLLLDDVYIAMRSPGMAGPFALRVAALQGMIFLLYSAFGVICFGLAIRPIHRLLRQTRLPLFLPAALFFFLNSLGVYLGLILRLNSWNIVNHPARVLRDARSAVSEPSLLAFILGYAVLLWLLYVAIDIWADGFAQRFHRPAKPDRERRGWRPAAQSDEGDALPASL